MTAGLLAINDLLALKPARSARAGPARDDKTYSLAWQRTQSSGTDGIGQPNAEPTNPPETDNNAAETAQRVLSKPAQTFLRKVLDGIAAESTHCTEQSADPQMQDGDANLGLNNSPLQFCLHASAAGLGFENPDPVAQQQPAGSVEPTEPATAISAAESASNVWSQPIMTAKQISGLASSSAGVSSSVAAEAALLTDKASLAGPAGLGQAASCCDTMPHLAKTAAPQAGIVESRPELMSGSAAVSPAEEAPNPAAQTRSVDENANAQPFQHQAQVHSHRTEAEASAAGIPRPLRNTEAEPTNQAGKNVLVRAHVQDREPLDVRTVMHQINNRTAMKDRAPGADTEHMVFHQKPQTISADTFANASAKAPNTSGLTPGLGRHRVSEQVIESIRASFTGPGAGSRIVIRLNPPELGKISVEFREDNNQLTGVLEVSKIQTRDQIQQALPEIVKTLHDAGVNLKKFDLQLSDQPQQQPFADQSLQDNGARQHDNLSHTADLEPEPAEQPRMEAQHQDVYEPQLLVTANTINMLI